jgi:hypothetical protein
MARNEANTGFKNSKNRAIFMSKSKTGKISYFAKAGDKKVYGVKAATKNGKTIKGNTTVPNKIRPAVRKGGPRGPRAATVVRKMVGGIMKRQTAGNKPTSTMARKARANRKATMKSRKVGGVVRRRVPKAPRKRMSESALATRRFGAMMTKLNAKKMKSNARTAAKANRAKAAAVAKKAAAANRMLAREEERASQMFFRAMSANMRKAASAAKKAAAAPAKRRASYARKALAAPRRLIKRSTSTRSRPVRKAVSPKRASSARAVMGPRRAVKSPKRKMSKSERSRRAKSAAARMSVSAKARRSQKSANTRRAKKGALNALKNRNPFGLLSKMVR